MPRILETASNPWRKVLQLCERTSMIRRPGGRPLPGRGQLNLEIMTRNATCNSSNPIQQRHPQTCQGAFDLLTGLFGFLVVFLSQTVTTNRKPWRPVLSIPICQILEVVRLEPIPQLPNTSWPRAHLYTSFCVRGHHIADHNRCLFGPLSCQFQHKRHTACPSTTARPSRST